MEPRTRESGPGLIHMPSNLKPARSLPSPGGGSLGDRMHEACGAKGPYLSSSCTSDNGTCGGDALTWARGDELDPRTWPLDVPTARAIYRDEEARKGRRHRRKAKDFLTWQFARLVEQAVNGGATQTSPHVYEWDLSRGCRLPGSVEHVAPRGGKGRVIMLVACRTGCEVCLKHRRNLWSARATTESLAAKRTWQATLTCAPEVLYRAECGARIQYEHRFGLRAVSTGPFEHRKTKFVERGWDDLTPGEQFGLKVDYLGKEVTKWLKRVRERCAQEWHLLGHFREDQCTAFRYLLVVERHKSGEPHWHLLMHEQSELQPIRYDWLKLPPRQPSMREWWLPPQVDARWGLGFSDFKLKPPERVTYVTKYLTKALLARVRASKGYGVHSPSARAEQAQLDPEKAPTSPRAGGQSPGSRPLFVVGAKRRIAF